AGAGLRQQKRLVARLIRPAQNLPSVRDLDAAPAFALVAAAQDGDLASFITQAEGIAQEAGEESHAGRLARAADGQIADADHRGVQIPRLEKVAFIQRGARTHAQLVKLGGSVNEGMSHRRQKHNQLIGTVQGAVATWRLCKMRIMQEPGRYRSLYRTEHFFNVNTPR